MAAGWLFDRLAAHFGKGQVFKDIDSIRPGDDFVKVITDAVGACDVLLALIGSGWLTSKNEDGQRRLDKPDDFVRLEIQAALQRDIRVIPVLIQGAQMPRAQDLPDSLAALVRRQAVELSPSRFDFDSGRLLSFLETALAENQGLPVSPGPEGGAAVPAKDDAGFPRTGPFAAAKGNDVSTSGPAEAPPAPSAVKGGRRHRIVSRRLAVIAGGVALVAAIGLVAGYEALSGATSATSAGWPFAAGGAVFTRAVYYAPTGAIYVGSLDGHVYALNANSGKLLWKYPERGRIGQIYSRPGVAGSMLYVGSNNGHVYALNIANNVRRRLAWQYPRGTGIGPVRTSPVLLRSSGLIYVGSDAGRFYALTTSGVLRWEYPRPDKPALQGYIRSTPELVDDVVWFGSDDGDVYALNAFNGMPKWRQQHVIGAALESSPSVSANGQVIYIGSEDGHVYFFDAATGRFIRKYPSRGNIGAIDSQPAVGTNAVYVATDGGRVYAFDWKTGANYWRKEGVRLPIPIGKSGGAVVTGTGFVYVGSGDRVYCLLANDGGACPGWHSYATSSLVVSVPMVNNGGNIYIGTQDGKVYALTSSGSLVR